MSSTCFEPESSPSGRQLYMQLWCGTFYLLKLRQKAFIKYPNIKSWTS